jgi:hypothetical protein
MFLCCGKLRLHDLNSNGLLEIEAGFGDGDPGLATSEEGEAPGFSFTLGFNGM